ncbi:hypothetical protein BVX94_02605 [bacterium B17]|nr:hypothetical protein BVX94_02605 [bacterium B17]
MDTRISKLAKLLIRYSIEAKKGQTIAVSGGPLAEPLLTSVYEELLKVGAFPVIQMVPDGLSECFFKVGKEHHFNTVTPYQRAWARNVDATINVYSEKNTRALTNVNPAKQAKVAKARKPLLDILKKKPWTLTLFPTEAYAQDAEMSLAEFEDFVYGAMFLDRDNPIVAWNSLSRKQDRLISSLKGADKVQIVGPGTDISFSVKGRSFVNSNGKHNMPSGEIFSGPVENSVEGEIEFDFPVCWAGREIDGVRLVFRKGKVVEATAEKNQKFLRTMLSIDAGASRIGEFGIGTNMGIQKFVKTILFDEKIGGTIHLALGRSLHGTGGKNKSALHWDMIKDLRKGGAIYIDGKVFQKDGKFKVR